MYLNAFIFTLFAQRLANNSFFKIPPLHDSNLRWLVHLVDMMRFQVFLSLLSVTSCSCIDKIPEVVKIKVSTPNIYSLSMLRLPRPPKTTNSKTPPHVYITMWKYLHNAAQMFTQRRCGFSNCSSVDAAMTGKRCVWAKENSKCFFFLH